MKNRFLLFVFFAVLLFIFAAQAFVKTQSSKEAKTRFRPKVDSQYHLVHDFGKVAEDSLVQHDFEIENPFAVPVTPDSVSVSCGCVDAQVEHKQVEIGQTIRAVVFFRPGSKRSNVRHSVEVNFTDKQLKPLRFQVVANVRPAFAATVERLDWDFDIAGESIERQFRIENFGDTRFKEVLLSSDVDWLETDISEIVVADSGALQTWQCKATVNTSSIVSGKYSGKLAALNSSGPEELNLPLDLFIRPKLLLFPGSLFFNLDEVDGRKVISKMVIRETEHPVPASDFSCFLSPVLVPHLKIRIEADPEDSLGLRLVGEVVGAPPSNLRGVLNIQCERFKTETTLPITVVGRNADAT
jgi:hypothetical protein